MLSTAMLPLRAQPPALRDTSVAAFRADLAAMQDTLFARHANAFHSRPRRVLEDSALAIGERFAQMEPSARIVAMARYIALIGDGHTRLWLHRRPDEHPAEFDRLPIRVQWFEEGLIVVAAAPAHRELLGARVERIGVATPEEALARVATVIAADNPQGARNYSPIHLTSDPTLRALRLRDRRGSWTFRLSDGAQKRVRLVTRAANDSLDLVRIQTPVAADASFKRPAIFTLWDTAGVVVFQANEMRDNGTSRLADAFDEALRRVDSLGAKRLILDFRYNPGGDASILRPLLSQLATRPALAQAGGVQVLIGRATFSAALWVALSVGQVVPAGYVGEPTSGKPNFYGETSTIELPRTGLYFSLARRFNQRSTADDVRPWLTPDVAVPLRFSDVRAGRDRVLETVLRRD